MRCVDYSVEVLADQQPLALRRCRRTTEPYQAVPPKGQGSAIIDQPEHAGTVIREAGEKRNAKMPADLGGAIYAPLPDFANVEALDQQLDRFVENL